jgi:hypothetical protein
LIPLHLPQLCQRAEASEFVEIHINTPIEQGYYYYRYKQCNDRSREKKEDCAQDDREKTNANDDQSDPFVAQQTMYVHVLSSLVGFFNKLASLLWRVALHMHRIGIRLLCFMVYHVSLPQLAAGAVTEVFVS